ncbi:MAG TPA: sigma-70 family RNA polymerase sigma factor [Candidatus Angelobacter sp.]|nr:sigma-70 family RNA polymerase sigma factor [Candidatus Angelobacter sp.]
MDTELIRQAQDGDKDAFAALATTLGARFLATSRRILGDVDLAEDATQQALLSIWRDLPQLRDPARFEAWSHRILVHACYAEGRRTRRWEPSLRLLPADEPAVDGLGSIADRDQIERAFRRLPIHHRTVVVLHHYLDMTQDEVAVTLGIPPGTVASRLHYAMRSMRSALEADARVLAQRIAR